MRIFKYILAFLVFGGFNDLNAQTNALYIPPTLSGTTFDLNMQHGTHEYYPGTPTASMGFNGDILGPTLVIDKNDDITINVTNSLGEETTVHWHGFRVSPDNDGGPHTVIDPNTTWSPAFEMLNNAATYWYHPHLHHRTLKQVNLGLSGMIIVKDPVEAALNLPRTYGVDDFPLIVQTKTILADTVYYFTTDNGNGAQVSRLDSTVVVNATVNAALDVPKQVVRLRVLNAADHRVFNLGLSNGANFSQIASDGGLLESPVSLNRLRLVPGERAEILVDLGTMSVGSSLTLKSYGSELPDGFWGAQNARIPPEGSPFGYDDNLLNGSDFDVLTLNVIGQTGTPVTTIPNSLVTINRTPETEADLTRTKYFLATGSACPQISSTPSASSSNCFDINVVNDEILWNATEIWELHGDPIQYHPFHIHDIQFFILDRDGNPPPANEMGWKDMVSVGPGEVVRFIGTFDEFVGTTPYMYHCHILPHEDKGMMQQFTVEQELYVDKNYTGVEKGSLNQPYNTIREALNVAFEGIQLNILSTGSHNEAPPDLLFSKEIELILHNPPVIIE